MLVLILANLLQTDGAGEAATWQPDPSDLTGSQSYTLRGARLQDARREVPEVSRALCGWTDNRLRSAPHRFVYVEHADGSPPEIFEENGMPAERASFAQLWGKLGCQ